MATAAATIAMTLLKADRLKTIAPWWTGWCESSGRAAVGLNRRQLERLIQPHAAQELGLPMTAFRQS